MIGMFVFFKQKKAYELRISDWRSDVCSSDLSATPAALMEGIAEGVYITELIGQGVNPVTGDYSRGARSEEHTSELQSLMRISYAVFCLKKKKKTKNKQTQHTKRHIQTVHTNKKTTEQQNTKSSIMYQAR